MSVVLLEMTQNFNGLPPISAHYLITMMWKSLGLSYNQFLYIKMGVIHLS